MPSSQLDNLVKIGQLKIEPAAKAELDGLIHSGLARLVDAENATLSFESRFDLAYNAAHALALAALRFHGYRSENRYVVFQALVHTLGLPNEQWRVLDQAHVKRNRSEYEGSLDVDTKALEALIRVAREVENRLSKLIASGRNLSALAGIPSFRERWFSALRGRLAGSSGTGAQLPAIGWRGNLGVRAGRSSPSRTRGDRCVIQELVEPAVAERACMLFGCRTCSTRARRSSKPGRVNGGRFPSRSDGRLTRPQNSNSGRARQRRCTSARRILSRIESTTRPSMRDASLPNMVEIGVMVRQCARPAQSHGMNQSDPRLS